MSRNGKTKKFIGILMSITLIAGLFSGLMFLKRQEETKAEDGEMIEVSVIKVWDDYDDYDGLRPESVSVTLKRGNDTLVTAILSDANNWYYKYNTPVARYDSNDEEIEYTWECESVNDYTRYVDKLDNMTIITDCHHFNEPTYDAVTLQKFNEKGEYLDNCKLRLKDIEGNVLINWTSDNANSIDIRDDSLSAIMNEDGSLVVRGLKQGEYIYEEVEPKAGYTSTVSKKFKVDKGSKDALHHWYTSLETAIADANNLNTDNADCYRDDANCKVGLFIIGNVANMIFIQNNSLLEEKCLDVPATLDLNDKKLFLTGENHPMVHYADDFTLIDGTIEGQNGASLIWGESLSEIASTGNVKIEDVNINENGAISGYSVLVLYGENVDINNTNINCSNIGVDIATVYLPSDTTVCNMKNTNITTNHASYVIYAKGELSLDNCDIEVEDTTKITSRSTIYGLYITNKLEMQDCNMNMEAGNYAIIMIDASMPTKQVHMANNSLIAKAEKKATVNLGVFLLGGHAVFTNNYIRINTKVMSYYRNECIRAENRATTEIAPTITITGGTFYSAEGYRNGVSYGAAINVQDGCGNLTINENDGDVYIQGGHSAVNYSNTSGQLSINGGTYESPHHGAYFQSSKIYPAQIRNATFKNIFDEIVTVHPELSITPFGSCYVHGDGNVGTHADFYNCTFINHCTVPTSGGGTALTQKSNDGYDTTSINLYNCYLSGISTELSVQNNDVVHDQEAYINIYEGTVLAHNMIKDFYCNVHGEPHIRDYRNLSDTLRILQQPTDIVLTSNSETVEVNVSAVGNGVSYVWVYSDDNGATWNIWTRGDVLLPNKWGTITIPPAWIEQGIQNNRIYKCKVYDDSGTVIDSDTFSISYQ